MKIEVAFGNGTSVDFEIPTEDESNDISNSLGDSSDLEDVSQVDDTSDGDSRDSDTSDSGSEGQPGTTSESGEVRPLLTTPLDSYTVTEGLLLLAVIILAGSVLLSLFRGR